VANTADYTLSKPVHSGTLPEESCRAALPLSVCKVTADGTVVVSNLGMLVCLLPDAEAEDSQQGPNRETGRVASRDLEPGVM